MKLVCWHCGDSLDDPKILLVTGVARGGSNLLKQLVRSLVVQRPFVLIVTRFAMAQP